MDNTATANTTTNRRHFIRLLGAAGCSVLIAPRLIGAARTTGYGADAEAADNRSQTVSATAKRACPCCE